MPAKIPKPSIPINTDSHKNGFLRFGKELVKNSQESSQAHKTQNINSSERKTSNDVQKHLKDYLLAVTKTGCSSSTIRNYKSDINQFLDFTDSKDLDDLRNKPKLLAFAHYQRDKGLKESSIKRKLVSITQFKIWLKQQGLISSEIPLHSLQNNEAVDLKARKIINQGNEEEAKKTETPEIKNQKKNNKPQSRIFILLNLLALFLFLGGLAFFAYQQFGQAIISLAYPSTPTAPNRILSYQGRLTNTAQSPISDPTAMTYSLYDDVTGGSLIWSSNTCTIDPDQDGIFNANLGAGSGTGADNENCGGTIGEDVFTLYSNVWLEVAVGAETLTPRQPIRTVAYAINSATLQGLPPAEVATNSTILMMNSAGEVVLGTDNPVIKAATSSSGMTIEANQITIKTTTGSNGDIILAPDGTGILDVQGSASVSGETTLIGNTYVSSPNSLIFGGTTALGEISSPTDSGAFLIGVYNEFDNSTSTNVQGVLNDLDAAIGSAGTSVWSDLTAPSADLTIEHSTYTTAFNWATGTGTDDLFSLTSDASSNGTGSLLNLQTGASSTLSPLRVRAGSTEALFVDNAGKVGIGTASPGQTLDVAGNIGFSGALMPNNISGTSGQFLISGGAGAAPTWTSTVSATSVPFSGITSGTNTTAAMVIGAGASLNYTSSGTINASSLLGGTWAAPGAIGSTTANTGTFTTLSSTGNTTFGDASTDTVTSNAAAWTFANDTNFALNGGVNGLSFDTNTLSIDATNNRVGIGTIAPNHTLDVNGNIGLVANGYLNWGSTDGSSGYGLRDNSGTIEYKNTSGDWAEIGSGNSLWNSSDGTLYSNNLTLDLLIGGNSTASAKFAFTNIDSGTPTFSMANQATAFDLFDNTVNALDIELGLMSFDTLNDMIGIGTTSPSGKLHIASAFGEGNPSYDGNNSLILQGNSIAADWNRLTIISGTSGSSVLEFGDKDDANIGFIRYDHLTNKLSFATNSSDPTDSSVVIDSSGRVGIGVSDPTSILQIGGASSTIVNDDGDITIDAASNNISLAGDSLINVEDGLFAGLIGIGTNTPSSALDIGTTDGSIVFSGSGAHSISTSSGTLSIGGHYVTGNIDMTNQSIVNLNSLSGYTDQDLNIYSLGTGDILLNADGGQSGQFQWWGGTSGPQIVFDNNGYVGIGNSSPIFQTEIFGVGQLTANLTDAGNRTGILALNGNSTDAGAGGAIVFGNSSSHTANSVGFAAIKGLLTNSATNTIGDLAFSTRNAISDTALTERMRILASGFVGIGTSTPDEMLTVNGSINAEKYYDLTNKAYYLDPASVGVGLKLAGSVDIAGNIGVGTSSSEYKLSIGGSSSIITNASGDITIDPASGNLSLAGNNLINVADGSFANGYFSNSVGIGVTSASSKLHIFGGIDGIAGGIRAYGANADGVRLSAFADDANNYSALYSWDENDGGTGAYSTLRLGNTAGDGLNVAGTTGNVGIGVAPSSTYELDVSGDIRASGEIISTAVNSFRMVYGNYGAFLRNDGTNTYFLLTASGDQYGSYNSLRPFYVNNSTGYVTFGNGHGDLAENYQVSGKVLRGTMVSIGSTSPSTAISSSETYQSLLGVISTDPGAVMDVDGGFQIGTKTKPEYNNEKAPIALTGAVPALVTSQNGVIGIGDAIGISSIPGFGAKMTSAGQIVGKALDNFDTNSCSIASSVESINWPEDDGKNSIKPCYRLPDGTYVGKIMVAVSPSWYDPAAYLQIADLALDANGDIVITGNSKDTYEIATPTSTIDRIATYADVFTARLQAGFIKTKELITDSLNAADATIDNLIATNFVVENVTSESGQIEIVSDVAINGDLNANSNLNVTNNVQIANNLAVDGETRLSELIVDNLHVNSATIEGELSAGVVETDELDANSARINSIEAKLANIENASVSGTLYAENIEANSISANIISGLKERLSEQIAETLTQPTLLAALFEQQNAQTDEYLSQLGQEINGEATPSATPTLAELETNISDSTFIADNAFINQYFEVNGNAFISDSLKIGQSLLVGENTVYGTDYISYQPTDVEDFTFHIQPAGMGRLSLMAGLMQLNHQGFVTINGDLRVAGALEVEKSLKVKDTLLTNMISAENPGENIQVQLASVQQGTDSATIAKSNFEFIDETQAPVATVSASGDIALTGSLRINQNTKIASESGELITGRSAGQAVLETGATEITIMSDKVEENSMIYVTPLNSTNNQVLYVKNKITDSSFTPENDGQFTVAIDYALGHNVVFNWWIIQLN